MIVPQVVAYGSLNEEKEATSDDDSVKSNLEQKVQTEQRNLSYIIMPRLDVDFATYLEPFQGIQKTKKIFEVVIQLIKILQTVHQSAIIFNDLKPDNIMVDRQTGKVTLIDFGFASTYLTAEGTHKSDAEMFDEFHGNILFASFDQMNFFQTSRKDDMIALYYILLYTLNNHELIGSKKDISLLT